MSSRGLSKRRAVEESTFVSDPAAREWMSKHGHLLPPAEPVRDSLEVLVPDCRSVVAMRASRSLSTVAVVDPGPVLRELLGQYVAAGRCTSEEAREAMVDAMTIDITDHGVRTSHGASRMIDAGMRRGTVTIPRTDAWRSSHMATRPRVFVAGGPTDPHRAGPMHGPSVRPTWTGDSGPMMAWYRVTRTDTTAKRNGREVRIVRRSAGAILQDHHFPAHWHADGHFYVLSSVEAMHLITREAQSVQRNETTARSVARTASKRDRQAVRSMIDIAHRWTEGLSRRERQSATQRWSKASRERRLALLEALNLRADLLNAPWSEVAMALNPVPA